MNAEAKRGTRNRITLPHLNKPVASVIIVAIAADGAHKCLQLINTRANGATPRFDTHGTKWCGNPWLPRTWSGEMSCYFLSSTVNR